MDRRDEVMDELRHDLKELGPLISAARGIVAHSPTSQITVNAGGLGLWVAVTACVVTMAVSLVVAVFVAFAIADLNATDRAIMERQDVQQAYINAAFSQPEEPKQ